MIDLLASQPLLLLFVVAAIGYPLGHIKIGGASLGVAAVLFVGLAIGALDQRLKLPEVVYQLGLILFVYTVGLGSGHIFFASFNRRGLRNNALVFCMIVFAFALAIGMHYVLKISPELTAGIFTGSTTNTAALASALEYLKTNLPADTAQTILNEPVVGYSIAYPMGVIAMMLAIVLTQKLWRIDYAAEAKHRRDIGVQHQELMGQTVRITNPDVFDKPIHYLTHNYNWNVIFGRFARDGKVKLADSDTVLHPNDLVSLIGTREAIDAALPFLGEPHDTELSLDRSELDYRRMFVSNRKIVGIPLRDLQLPRRLGTTITRVRRGDIEMLPNADTRLELGDRVRVITRRDDMEKVGKFFGDSYRSLSEIDILTFNLGLVVGLLIGLIEVPLPGGVSIKLGFAGGPLLVALILGALDRTGNLVWHLPYSANLTIRQIGLVFFLAGVGTRAGFDFVKLLTSGSGLPLFLGGAAITFILAMLTLFIGYKIMKIPMGLLVGMLSGLQTQPALLGFSLAQAKNELPNQGYASVYPLALITKIILAQVLLAVLL